MTALDVSGAGLVHSGAERSAGVPPRTVPGSKITMQVFLVGPGESALPDNPPGTETAGYLISGRAQLRFGEGSGDHRDVLAGDFYFSPVGVPYALHNLSAEPAKLVLAYSMDPTVT